MFIFLQDLLKSSYIHVIRKVGDLKRIIILVCSAFFSWYSFGQLFEYKQYNTRSGLAQSVVSNMTEDQFHQLWIATYDGISVFDGQNFKTISTKEGLPVPITVSLIAHQNKIYAGLRGYLIEIDPEQKIPKTLKALKRQADIRCFFAAGDSLFFSSDSMLFLIYKNQVTDISSQVAFRHELIRQIKFVGTEIYVLTGNYIFVYDSVQSFPSKLKTKYKVQTSFGVEKFDGKIVSITTNSLSELKEKENEMEPIYPFGEGETFNGLINYKNKYLVVYGSEGLQIFDSGFHLKNKFNYKTGFTQNRISNVFVDSQENLWVMTEGDGIFQIRNFDSYNYNRKSGFDFNFTYVLCRKSDHEFYAGSVANGLALINSDGKILKRWFEKEKTVTSAAIDPKGILWFDLQGNDLYKLENDHPVKVNIPDIIGGNIRKLDFDQSGRMWMGTNYGLYRMTGNKIETLVDGTQTGKYPYVADFVHLSENHSFIATELNGIYEIVNDRVITIDSTNSNFTAKSIKRLILTKENKLWVATTDGLFSSSDYRVFNKVINTNLYNAGAIWGLMEDSMGRIWASASSGIFVIDHENIIFLNEDFGVDPSEYNRFSLMEDKDHFVWAGSVSNLVKISPDILKTIPETPHLRIRKLETNLGTCENLSENKFPRKVKWIQFDLGISDFVARHKLKFFYRISNRDSSWLSVGNNSNILIDNLSSGDYNIELMATDFLGRKTNIVKSSFKIPAPYWQSFWFFLGVILIVGMISYNIHLYRLRILSDREKKLEELIISRTEALTGAKQFIENLIDSATEIIFSADTNGKIQIWNMEAENFFGFSKEAIVNQHLSIIDQFKAETTLFSVFDQAKDGGVILRKKIELQGRFQDYSILLVSSYPLRDETGKIVNIVFMLTDLKQHRLLEAELIEKERFIAGMDVLKSTLSTITHYVNNSITAIIGTAEMARTKDKFKDKLVDIAINQSLEIRAVIKSLENLNSKLDLKTKEYPDLTHQIFDIQHEIEMHLKKYKSESEKA